MREFSIQRCVLVREETLPYKLPEPVKGPADVVQICIDLGLHALAEEVVSMFTFDSQGALLGYHEISHGEVTASMVHPREVFKRALLENACSIMLTHNHPSRQTKPSTQDRAVTKRIAEVAALMGIHFTDHIIIAPDKSFVSLRATESELFETKPIYL